MSERIVLTQSELVDFFLDQGWKPFFLEPDECDFDEVKFQLQREIEVAIADGRHQMVREILTFLDNHRQPEMAEELAALIPVHLAEDSPQLERQSAHPMTSEVIQGALLKCLQNLDLKPRFLGDSDGDLADQCGREMKHLRAEQRHDVVVQLGDLAERLKLKHKRIVVNLRESRRAIRRANQLIVLKAYKESSNRSRREYEAAILTAWLADPDCSDYVDLLSNVVAFRQRKQASTLNLDSFESEWIDYRVNKRLWNALSETMEGDARSDG